MLLVEDTDSFLEFEHVLRGEEWGEEEGEEWVLGGFLIVGE